MVGQAPQELTPARESQRGPWNGRAATPCTPGRTQINRPKRPEKFRRSSPKPRKM